MARKCVCLLSPEEADDFKIRGLKPNCADHRHTTEIEAREMAGIGDFKPYNQPIAEWIGPHHVRVFHTFSFRGLSCKLGEYHYAMLMAKRPWARVMFEEMQRP